MLRNVKEVPVIPMEMKGPFCSGTWHRKLWLSHPEMASPAREVFLELLVLVCNTTAALGGD